MRTALVVTGFALLLLSACSSSDDKKKSELIDERYLGLSMPAEGEGFQIRNIGKDVAPGEDVEYCEVAEMPGDPDTVYYVNRIELGNGDASHHLIVDTALPDGAAAARLADMDIGDQVACVSSQSAFGDGFEFTAGVQRPYGEFAFPPGVGRVYHGGQRFIFDFHYYNTGSETVQARSAVNFHLTEAENVQRIAQVVGFNNVLIDTPPGESRSFTGECRYGTDAVVPSVTRHTHRWGTDFQVWFAGGERDGESFWTSSNFQEDTYFQFDEPLTMKAGEGFRFRCDFQNTETHSLRFGPNATDEMCILFSLAWETEVGSPLPDQSCSIVQLGEDGIGRALEPGSYPAPTPEQEQACRDGSDRPQACEDCSCTRCGAVIADCASDTACGAILDCLQAAGCYDQSCSGACSEVINANSSGTGKLIQLATCVSETCSEACSTAP